MEKDFQLGTRGYWADTGGDFVNKEIKEFMAQFGHNITYGPVHRV